MFNFCCTRPIQLAFHVSSTPGVYGEIMSLQIPGLTQGRRSGEDLSHAGGSVRRDAGIYRGYLAYSQRVLVEHLVEHQTTDLAESYFDNINTLMLTGGMANRDIPRNKLLARPEVLDARIIRGDAVVRLYGPGSDYAAARDELDRSALTGEAVKRIREGADGRVLTVLVPLKASKDFRGIDCISCHASAEGEVLGAVRVDYSLSRLDAAVDRDLPTGQYRYQFCADGRRSAGHRGNVLTHRVQPAQAVDSHDACGGRGACRLVAAPGGQVEG